MEKNTKRLNDAYDYLLYKHKIGGQEDMAKALGTSRPNVTNMLNGKVKVSDDTLRKVLEAFPDIFNVAWMFGEDEVMLIENLEFQKKQNEIPEYVQNLIDVATKLITKNEMLERKLEKSIAQNRDLGEQLSSLLTIIGANPTTKAIRTMPVNEDHPRV